MQKKYLFHYVICKWFDENIFKQQCKALENRFPEMEKEKLLEDVDGSAWQLYHHEKGNIKVGVDYQVGYVYIDSDFDLIPYFEKK